MTSINKYKNKHNKQMYIVIVPDRTHVIYKMDNTRLNLYTKITNFNETQLIQKSKKSTKIK